MFINASSNRFRTKILWIQETPFDGSRGGWQRGLEPSLRDHPSKEIWPSRTVYEFYSNKHGGGEEGELAELAVIWCTRVCVGSALFPLFQV